ncbi:MAG: PorT family protein [Spirochaetes bacterium]|nr:PorT family protein [Spirochaetota bacterium]
MKKSYIFIAVFLFIGGLFSVSARDLIILRDGSIIEARVIEISPTEIRYRRFDHLTGPIIVLPVANVLSIRYEDGRVDIFNVAPAWQPATAAQQRAVPATIAEPGDPGPGLDPLLQAALNQMPAIPIPVLGSLNFTFASHTWHATHDGANLLSGTTTFEETGTGLILTLRQTHIYIRGRRVSRAGPSIILEFAAGPPPSLNFVGRERQERERRERVEGQPIEEGGRRVTGGFTAGLNHSWLGGGDWRYYDASSKFAAGFELGAYLNIAATNIFSIQPELNFLYWRTKYSAVLSFWTWDPWGGFWEFTDATITTTIRMFEIPVLAKFSTTGHTRFSFYFGPAVMLVLGDLNYRQETARWGTETFSDEAHNIVSLAAIIGMEWGIPAGNGEFILDFRYRRTFTNIFCDWNLRINNLGVRIGYGTRR